MIIDIFVWYVVEIVIRDHTVVFFQAEDGIRDLVRSRGLGDVYKRQELDLAKIDTSIKVLGKTLKTPLLISSMTGGTARALSLIHI